jgi:hypothetical protein
MILWFATLKTSSFIQEHGGTWMTCVICFEQTLRSGILCQVGELWISPNWGRFIDYIIVGNGVHIDLHKVQTIINWATLIFVRNIQCFFVFANFYWSVILHHSTIIHVLFIWFGEINLLFGNLKLNLPSNLWKLSS